MQCYSPYEVSNPHFGIKGQNMYLPVPCGKCIPCLKKRAGHWSFRLEQETKISSSSCFLTLTYAPEHEPRTWKNKLTLKKRDFQLFMKRLRKKCPTNKLKYYACGEYGDNFTKRPHYHVIMFNLPHSIINSPNILNETWGLGNVDRGTTTIKSVRYVVGYMNKHEDEDPQERKERLEWEEIEPEFSLMSKCMGANFLTPQTVKYYRDRKLTCIVIEDGKLLSMPRYYKEKRLVKGKEFGLFTKQQRKAMQKEWQIHHQHIEEYGIPGITSEKEKLDHIEMYIHQQKIKQKQRQIL